MLHAAVMMLHAVDIYLSWSHSYDSGIFHGCSLSTNDSLNKDDNDDDNDLQIPFFFELCFNTKALL